MALRKAVAARSVTSRAHLRVAKRDRRQSSAGQATNGAAFFGSATPPMRPVTGTMLLTAAGIDERTGRGHGLVDVLRPGPSRTGQGHGRGGRGGRRKVDPKPDDPYRGVYTDDREIDHLLSQHGAVPRRPPPDPSIDAARDALTRKAETLRQAGTRLRLDDLADAFRLERFDVDLLLVALAPDLDPSFEKLYGYLNDDVTRRRASVGLALELCGASAVEGWARSRLASAAPLVSGSLVSVEDSDRPLLGRSLRVPDRVVDHLLGRDEPDP